MAAPATAMRFAGSFANLARSSGVQVLAPMSQARASETMCYRRSFEGGDDAATRYWRC
ncbi:hypothetical protein BTZ20_2148 [Rhodococcus sp. MTM3W5.2]|nr:hypothetical protein BTZ20_2148 [Rhodococcus sp. MTM3W5.2]